MSLGQVETLFLSTLRGVRTKPPRTRTRTGKAKAALKRRADAVPSGHQVCTGTKAGLDYVVPLIPPGFSSRSQAQKQRRRDIVENPCSAIVTVKLSFVQEKIFDSSTMGCLIRTSALALHPHDSPASLEGTRPRMRWPIAREPRTPT